MTAPVRQYPLPGLRRPDSSMYDADCDEVYPSIFIGDMYVRNYIILILFIYIRII